MPSLKDRLLEICEKEESGFLGWTVRASEQGARKNLIHDIYCILNTQDWQDEKALTSALSHCLTKEFYYIQGELFDRFHKKLWNAISLSSESPWPRGEHAYQKIKGLISKVYAGSYRIHLEEIQYLKWRRSIRYMSLTFENSCRIQADNIVIPAIKSLMFARLFTYDNILRLDNITCLDTWKIISWIEPSVLTQKTFDLVAAFDEDQARVIYANSEKKLFIYLYFMTLSGGKFSKNITDFFYTYLYCDYQVGNDQSCRHTLMSALQSLYINKFKSTVDITVQDIKALVIDIEAIVDVYNHYFSKEILPFNFPELLSRIYFETAKYFNHSTVFFETILLPRLKILNDLIKNEVLFLLLTTRFQNNRVIETENLELFKLIDPAFDESFVMNHAKNIRLDEIFRQMLEFYGYMYDNAPDNAEKESFLIMLREFVTAAFEFPYPVFLILTLDILKNLADQKESQYAVPCIDILLNLQKNFYQPFILFDLRKLSDKNHYSINVFISALTILEKINAKLVDSTFFIDEKSAICNDITEEYKLIDYAMQASTHEHTALNETLTDKSCILYRPVQQKELSMVASARLEG